MSDHEIETVRGNIVDVRSSSGGVSNNFNQLSDKLSSPDIKDFLPAGKTGKDLINDSMLCRMQELGAKIEDLIEDGFGLGSIIDGFKMPSMSEIGEKLKQMNPLNLLDKLNDVSLESITAKAGELINGVVDKIESVVTDTFNQIERAVKGIGDMFDEFGTRIQDLEKLAADTITGIVGGLGEVLQDITKPVEDLINTLTKPCDGGKVSASQQAQNNLQQELAMFDTDMEIMRGNIVSADSIGHTSGTFTNVIREAVANNAPVTVPIGASSDPVYVNNSPDGKEANERENQQRAQAEQNAMKAATNQATNTVVRDVENQKNSVDNEEQKQQDIASTDEKGHQAGAGAVFDPGDCDSLHKKYFYTADRMIDRLTNVVNENLVTVSEQPVDWQLSRPLERFLLEHLFRLVIAKTKSGSNLIVYCKTTRPEEFDRVTQSKTTSDQQQYEKLKQSFLTEPLDYGVLIKRNIDLLQKQLEILDQLVADHDKLKQCDFQLNDVVVGLDDWMNQSGDSAAKTGLSEDSPFESYTYGPAVLQTIKQQGSSV